MWRREDQRHDPVAAAKVYRLVYPSQAGAAGKRLEPGRTYPIPSASLFMRMDGTPGVEKLFLIYSSKPLNLVQHFAAAGEKVLIASAPVTNPPVRAQTPPGKPASEQAVDTDDQILARLDDDLKTYGANAVIARNNSEKGITIGPAPADGPSGHEGVGSTTGSYGVVTDSSKPASFEITLKHMR